MGRKPCLQFADQNSFTHAFVAEFESVADRDYYVREDPYHAQFAQGLGPLLGGVQVLDFFVPE
ncbi:hypothetical protein AWENTII_004356 [Aspergillus wentii]